MPRAPETSPRPPRVRAFSGAEVGILIREAVGREPLPTEVFCGALVPIGPLRVGEFEMIDMGGLAPARFIRRVHFTKAGHRQG